MTITKSSVPAIFESRVDRGIEHLPVVGGGHGAHGADADHARRQVVEQFDHDPPCPAPVCQWAAADVTSRRSGARGARRTWPVERDRDDVVGQPAASSPGGPALPLLKYRVDLCRTAVARYAHVDVAAEAFPRPARKRRAQDALVERAPAGSALRSTSVLAAARAAAAARTAAPRRARTAPRSTWSSRSAALPPDAGLVGHALERSSAPGRARARGSRPSRRSSGRSRTWTGRAGRRRRPSTSRRSRTRWTAPRHLEDPALVVPRPPAAAPSRSPFPDIRLVSHLRSRCGGFAATDHRNRISAARADRRPACTCPSLRAAHPAPPAARAPTSR